MNMRINAIGSPGGWNMLSISIDDLGPPRLGGLPPPGGDEEEDDPFDIDGANPAESSSSAEQDAAGNSSLAERGLLAFLLLLAMLGMRHQGESEPDARHSGSIKGKKGGGGCHAGGPDSVDGGDDSVHAPPNNYAPHQPPGQDDSNKVGDSGKPSKVGGAGKIPAPTGTVTVNETIVVKAGQTFDGGGKLYKAGPALGDGGQSEDQKPVFVLEPGAKLKNLQYEGADGIHTMGDATIKDVWARDVGEDAMTMKKPGNVIWSGGGAFNASDKIFQLNAGGSFTLENFTADNFGKAVRTNGGKQIETDITIRNSRFTNGDEAIVRTDSTVATITLQDIMFSNVPNDVLAPAGTEVRGAHKRGSK